MTRQAFRSLLVRIMAIAVNVINKGTGNREQGTGNREQGTGNREQ
jgi:hypothetical protein